MGGKRWRSSAELLRDAGRLALFVTSTVGTVLLFAPSANRWFGVARQRMDERRS